MRGTDRRTRTSGDRGTQAGNQGCGRRRSRPGPETRTFSRRHRRQVFRQARWRRGRQGRGHQIAAEIPRPEDRRDLDRPRQAAEMDPRRGQPRGLPDRQGRSAQSPEARRAVGGENHDEEARKSQGESPARRRLNRVTGPLRRPAIELACRRPQLPAIRRM